MQNNLLKKGVVFFILSIFTVTSIFYNINVSAEIFENVSLSDRNIYFNSLFKGEPPEEEWNKTFGGTDYDEGYCIRQSNDDGYIITGYTNSFGEGNWDAWLIKTDSNGNEQWNHTFGGIQYDRGYSVQQTKDGGYVIAGCTYSFGSGGFDVWLIKTNSEGIEEWNHTFGGISEDVGYSLQQTNDSGYIITGYTQSYGVGESDVWLIKTNSDGVEEWNRTFGVSTHDKSYSVQQTNDHGYIITGYTVGYSGGVASCDVWLIKTDSEGIKEWDHKFGGNGVVNKIDMGYSVQQTKDGGYIIIGNTEILFVSDADIYMIKTNSEGIEEWNQTFGGPYTDQGRSVQQTREGGYIIAGSISSSVTKDPDICLIKTNSTGIEEWSSTFGYAKNSSDWGFSVRQTNDNGFIISGATIPNGWNSISSKDYKNSEGTNLWLIKVESENLPPSPPIIDGPKRGKPNIEHKFTFSTIDLDEDEVYYYIDWNDSNIEEWIGPYASGVEVSVNHTWEEKGSYIIKAKAKDIYNLESDWTTFDVEISKARMKNNFLFLKVLKKFSFLESIISLKINQ